MAKKDAVQGRGEANEIRALWMVDKPKARAMLLAAFEAEDGNAVHTAVRLGIGHRTILRYLDDTQLGAAVEKIRTRAAKAAKAARVAAEKSA